MTEGKGYAKLKAQTSLTDILAVATEFERTARDFYTQLAPKVSKSIRYLVEELAEEEQRHFELFTKLRNRPDIESQVQQMVHSDRGAHQPLCWRVIGPVDNQGLADDVLPRNESPVPAVQGRVAVVAHREEAVGRDDDGVPHHVRREHLQRGIIKPHVRLTGEVVAVGVDVIRLVELVRFVQLPPVQEDLLVHDPDRVTGNADHPLDKGLFDIDGVAENDDVAALHLLVGQNMPAQGAGRRVGELVHQQVVADEKRVLHRTRGNYERLDERRCAKQQQQYGHGPFRDRSALLRLAHRLLLL